MQQLKQGSFRLTLPGNRFDDPQLPPQVLHRSALLSRRNFHPRPENKVSTGSGEQPTTLQPGPCPISPFPPVPRTKATDTSVTTSNVVVEQVPQGAHRAPLVGSPKASSGHRWDRREGWEKPPCLPAPTVVPAPQHLLALGQWSPTVPDGLQLCWLLLWL